MHVVVGGHAGVSWAKVSLNLVAGNLGWSLSTYKKECLESHFTDALAVEQSQTVHSLPNNPTDPFPHLSSKETLLWPAEQTDVPLGHRLGNMTDEKGES